MTPFFIDIIPAEWMDCIKLLNMDAHIGPKLLQMRRIDEKYETLDWVSSFSRSLSLYISIYRSTDRFISLLHVINPSEMCVGRSDFAESLKKSTHTLKISV